jgi:hypothetical protein
MLSSFVLSQIMGHTFFMLLAHKIRKLQKDGDIEPAPTSAPWRMDGKWLGNNFFFRF